MWPEKGFRKKILISLAAFFLIFSLVEIIMRFAWQMGGWVERPIYQRSANPYLRYELLPRAKTERIRINSDGFRGREYSVPKPARVFRMIMLGDSETFSYLLPESDCLASQLEALLNKNSKNTRYEVLNFGVEGYGTLQELEMFKTKGAKYNPDLIILNYCLNDPEPGEYYFNKTFLIRHSAMVRYFSFRFKKSAIKKERRRLGIKTEIDNYYYYHQPKYFSTVKDALLELATFSRKSGHKLVVVIFPTSSIMVKDFKENYPYGPLHQVVKSIPSESIIFIDLIEEFNRLGLTPQQASINYLYDESHKNPACLVASAEYIRNILISNKQIPE